MTPADQIRRDTHTAQLLAIIINSHLKPTLTNLEAQADNIDGYPTTASGSDSGPPGNDTTSTVERAVLNRNNPNPDHFDRAPIAALTEGQDLARTIIHAQRLLLDWCDTHSGTRLTATELDELRCTNWRRDDPHSCGNIATPRRHNNQTIDDKRCLPCGLLHDELEDQRRTDSNQRRLTRHKAGAT